MIFDGKQLSIGSTVYSFTGGYGKVIMVTDAGAVANFDGQEVAFNALGQIVGSDSRSTKVVGLDVPLAIWPQDGENVQRLLPIINEAIILMSTN